MAVDDVYKNTVGFAMEVIGLNVMSYIFTYPMSFIDTSQREALYWASFALVIIPPMLSCLPVVKQNTFKVFELSTLVFFTGAVVATYFSYVDDVASQGDEQVQAILDDFAKRSSNFENVTGVSEFVEHLFDSAFESTSYLHIFILNVLCCCGILFTHFVVKCVRENGVNLIGFIGSSVTLFSVFSIWSETLQRCFNDQAKSAVNGTAIANSDSVTEAFRSSAKQFAECSFEFDNLQTASNTMVGLGCMFSFLTLFLVMLRAGVFTMLANCLCCCLGSICGTALTCATCNIISSSLGDALVLIGVTLGAVCVSTSHFVLSAWLSQLEGAMVSSAESTKQDLTFANETDFIDTIENFFQRDWDSKSTRELVNGIAIVIPCLALAIRIIEYFMKAGCNSQVVQGTSSRGSDASDEVKIPNNKGTLEYNGGTAVQMV